MLLKITALERDVHGAQIDGNISSMIQVMVDDLMTT